MQKILNLLKDPKQLAGRFITLFSLTVLMFWAKSYIVYLTQFKLGVEGWYQHFLLFINPLSSCLLFFGIAFIFKNKGQYRALLFANISLSLWLYANAVYYRFFTDFLTIPSLFAAPENAGQLSDSIIALMHPADVLFFVDTVIIAVIIFRKSLPLVKPNNYVTLRRLVFASLCVFLLNLGLAEVDRPQLLSRTFDRNYLVKYLGVYNFTVYDAVQNAKSNSQRALANADDIVGIEEFVRSNYVAPNPDYFGKAEGRNVVYISLESLQNFIIDYELDGQEVMPFLNALKRHENTFYFDNFFHQTGQGKTADSEFIMETALFPTAQGAVYVNKANNVQQALPAILRQNGDYYSATLHGNYKTFWNRNEMYRSMGYDQFFDAQFYDMSDPKNAKNYGLKDIPFFQESVPILSNLPQPFFAKMITLSNHFPFGMDPEDTDFPVGDFGDVVVDQYFQSANYLDVALEMFFEELKANDLYENSIFVLYGDHYGLSHNRNKAMARVLEKEEITPFDYAGLQRMVFMIHAPGIEGGVNHTYSGQIDVRPTILHLLGIDTKDFLSLGSDMLSPDRHQIVPFRNGSFITPEYTFVGDKIYENETGLITTLPEDIAAELQEQAKSRLRTSDEIITKDLLRFYTPTGFEPVDPSRYQYLTPTPEEVEYYQTIKSTESEPAPVQNKKQNSHDE